MSRGTAAVTGASRGIGRETSLLLARAGYRVFALARNEADLAELAQQHESITPVVLDIADEASRVAAVSQIFAGTAGAGLDVLVNNAGYGQMGPLEEVSPEELRRQFEVNVIALHAFTLPFIAPMRERRRGWIVNVSSAAGRISTPFMGAYSASKFAVEAMSDAMRLELRPFGVHVILIEPGPIRSSFGTASRDRRRPESPYERMRKGSDRAHRVNDLFEGSPQTVARTIVKAVESAHPRARYTVTLSAKLGTVARRLVPDVVMDRVLAGGMGLTGDEREGGG